MSEELGGKAELAARNRRTLLWLVLVGGGLFVLSVLFVSFR